MDHPSLAPTFLSGFIDSEGSSLALSLFLETVVDEPSCHGLASSVFGITDGDIEL